VSGKAGLRLIYRLRGPDHERHALLMDAEHLRHLEALALAAARTGDLSPEEAETATEVLDLIAGVLG
jgi:hypothetical protein